MLSNTFAVAAFGSSARGDSDSMSDRDLLVVCDTMSEVRATKARFVCYGWEVSGWTWASFIALSKRGSLFVDHLSREAVILWDPSNNLRDTLASFQLRADYFSEMTDGLALAQVASVVPSSVQGIAWAADVLSCAFRTYAVPFMCHHGEHTYSNAGLVEGVCRVRGLGSWDSHLLTQLRSFKRAFRGGGGLADVSVLCDTFRAVGKALDVELGACVAHRDELLERSIGRINREPNGYRVSRIAEGLLLSNYVNPESDLKTLWGCIRQPHQYARGFGVSGRLRGIVLNHLVA